MTDPRDDYIPVRGEGEEVTNTVDESGMETDPVGVGRSDSPAVLPGIWSYPKIYNLGHRALAELFDGSVFVQEKYDGSQLSWAWVPDESNRYELFVKSKGRTQVGGGTIPDGLFQRAVDYLLTLEGDALPPYSKDGRFVVFRGEWFSKPKHNTLAYDEVPPNGLLLYDVEWGPSDFATPAEVRYWADRQEIGVARTLELLNTGRHPSLEDLEHWMEERSTLGGPLVEGVVFKNYDKADPFQPDKVLMGKHVSPVFREKHGKAWKAKNPGTGDVLRDLIDQLNTEARWEKAIQHMRDDGVLEGSPRDIGPLMKEVKDDTWEEEYEWIVGQLLRVFRPKIMRGLGRGLPEWYKARLLQEAIQEGNETVAIVGEVTTRSTELHKADPAEGDV